LLFLHGHAIRAGRAAKILATLSLVSQEHLSLLARSRFAAVPNHSVDDSIDAVEVVLQFNMALERVASEPSTISEAEF
jgi:hypothetical protein